MADSHRAARRRRRESYMSTPVARASRSDEQSAPAHVGARRSSMTASWHSHRSDAGESTPGPDGARRAAAPTRFRMTSSTSSLADAPASPLHTPTCAPVAFGAPAFDPGTKYIQRVGPLTPVESVVPLPYAAAHDASGGSRSGRHRRRSREHLAGALRGARMEDSAVVVPRLGTAAGVSLAVVADGHGSVPMVSRRLDSRDTSEPTVFVGGPECAALAAASASRYLARVADAVDMGRLTREGIACVLRDAFLFAQRMCAEETARGCLVQGEEDGDAHRLREGDRSTARSSSSHSASDHGGRSRARRGSSATAAVRRIGGRLDRSAIDGAYFAKVHGPAGASLAERGDPRALVVVDKVRVPYRPLGANGAPGPKGHLVYYVEANGRRTLAEYGTTLTAVLITPLLPSDMRRGRASKGWLGRVFVAHAGDSDVFLFHRDTQARRSCHAPSRLTDDHTPSNRDEVARLAPYGVGVHPPYYFVVTTGPECGQMLMPSRSLGHVLMSQHRITAVPSISTALVAPGDVVVAASDGLWASYGRAGGWHPPQLSPDAPAPTDETLSAMRVATVLDGLSDGIASGSISPADVARILRDDVVRHVVRKRDNVAIVVGICQPPMSFARDAGTPHGRQVLGLASRHH
ncbi:Serine/threonine phosphatases incomplete domain containing protein [Pandoravirus neocaledonia]|uniref:Serine/threonine phosphatases incomplete domain containing protein n=1 Tax=Pandoravirus neocaledonia TaxID=2107708 RepID=A0A2U7UBF6_9VIRU|nr:Serine/threonine phosphatases incomplete domain containing protein [Pandoravirus neocaledonia]AVK75801.1 Serine/threonine phosphatases incomplete domain containing protein [Pandoravirus neocaledonia]